MSEMIKAQAELIAKNESTEAFRAVLTVGKQFSDQLQAARDANDEVAESMLYMFGMTALQDAIKAHPQAMDVILRGHGNKWGFRTDRDFGKRYDNEVIIPCVCEALLNKLRPVGNEFNIISSSMYVTKEGWLAQLERLPGVTLVDCRCEVFSDSEVREFTTKNGETKYKMTASIGATASCEVWGRHVAVEARMVDGRDERVQVSASSEFTDQVIDQVKGKVEARMYQRLYYNVRSLSKAGPSAVAPVIVSPAAITHGEPQQTYQRAPVSRQPETERTIDSTPRGQMRSRLERQPEKLNLIEGWWNAVDAAKTMAALTDLWNTMTVSESVNDVTAGDLKELKAEFTRRKLALQSVKP